ncbi:MAG: inorganic phosphate transporter [Proteobacteria bacterium]|nr:inorganic phosphate transporter [Pseudomonadota bacterium]
MDIAVLLFLTSGLFLGWALGGNDAANVFGTAVGTQMIRFTTAAVICSVFVVLGAVISGAGPVETLGRLGSVNALAGSFMAAFSAALAVYVMTKFGLPVSTTQAIIGGILGWNLFSETVTDTNALFKIVSTWVLCPLLAAGIAMVLFKMVTAYLRASRLHLLRTDAYTRLGLILAGALGAYSLGANNIANVVGVFVASSPFNDFSVFGVATFTAAQQLFLIGGLAIAVGVLTYSKRVMLTVGSGLMPLSPVAAWVVVVAHSLVLLLFASEGLERMLAANGLPTIPLVPVSSSQAVVGAVLGIAILKGGRGIRWNVLGGIGMGWVLTPLLAGLVCFIGLFFLQNVFGQTVYRPVPYVLSEPVLERLERAGMKTDRLGELRGQTFSSARRFRQALGERMAPDGDDEAKLMAYAEVDPMAIDPARLPDLETSRLSAGQVQAVRGLTGRTFMHTWMLAEALAGESGEWRPREKTTKNKAHNKRLRKNLDFVFRTFRVGE